METLHVVKIGGNIIDDEQKLSSFLAAFAKLEGKKILVHGGGKLATRLAGDLGVAQKMIDGRRITDAETLRIVTMVYAGYINKNIVSKLQSFGCRSMGLVGADGGMIRAHKRIHPAIDYGFVGDVDAVNTSVIQNILEQDIALIVAPITDDGNGQLLNTNADTIAQEIAKALGGMYKVALVYSFEKNGVLIDVNDNSSVIPVITPSYYAELKGKGLIFAGMLPKLDNAFSAIDHHVAKVIIGNAEELSSLVEGVSGTTITNE